MKQPIKMLARTLLMAIFCFVLNSCSSTESTGTSEHQSKNSHVVHVSDATYDAEVLKSTTPVLVDFWAPWCGPCRMMGPIVDEISNDFVGKLKVVKINTDENPQSAKANEITGIPTLKLFKSGKVVDQVVGAVEKSALTEVINKHL